MSHTIVLERPATCWRARCESCGWVSEPELHKRSFTRHIIVCPNSGEAMSVNTEHSEIIQKVYSPNSVIAELLGHTGSCPKDHSNEVENGSLWDCDHPECVALQHAAENN